MGIESAPLQPGGATARAAGTAAAGETAAASSAATAACCRVGAATLYPTPFAYTSSHTAIGVGAVGAACCVGRVFRLTRRLVPRAVNLNGAVGALAINIR